MVNKYGYESAWINAFLTMKVQATNYFHMDVGNSKA